MAYNQRGLDSSQEQNQQQIIRDTRTLGMRAQAVLKNPHALSIVMVCFALSAFMMGSISELLLMLGVGCFFYGYFQKHSLPFRMPEVSREKITTTCYPMENPAWRVGFIILEMILKRLKSFGLRMMTCVPMF